MFCRGVQCRGVQCRGVQCRGVQCRGVQCRGVRLATINVGAKVFQEILVPSGFVRHGNLGL